MNCSEYREMIDRNDDLNEDSATSLETHLSECEACTAYSELAARSRQTLSALASALPPMPAQRVSAQIERRLGEERRAVWIGSAGVVVSLIGLFWILTQGASLPGILILGGWFLGSGWYTWWTSRRLSRFHGLGESAHFRSDWQRELDQKIRLTTVVAVVVGLEVVGWFAYLLLSGFSGEGAVIHLMIAGTLGVGVLYAAVVELPLMKKERTLLSEFD